MIEIGDLVEWCLPDMLFPILGLVLRADDDAIEILWTKTGNVDWVKPEHCKVAI